MQFFCLIQHQNFVFQLNFENRRVRTTQLGHGTRRRPEFIDNEEVNLFLILLIIVIEKRLKLVMTMTMVKHGGVVLDKKRCLTNKFQSPTRLFLGNSSMQHSFTEKLLCVKTICNFDKSHSVLSWRIPSCMDVS